MSSYSLDVVSFISEVEKYPEIWDIRCEDNRFKSKKLNAWAEIARVFIEDFDDMPDKEKQDVYQKLHGKWRNIRDSFVRHIKRRYSKRGYVYAKNLTFLNDVYNKNSQSESDVEWECGEHSDNEDTKPDIENKRFDLLSDTSLWVDQEDSPSTTENSKKRKHGKPEAEIEYVDTPFADAPANFTSTSEDEDRSFFESLLPAVRQFNIDQKLEFRSEVLCLIKRLRSNNGNSIYNIKRLDPNTGKFS